MINIKETKQFAEGIIRVHRLPFDNDEEYEYWWLPKTNGRGKILRPARMGQREKARYLEVEGHNQIMNAGRSAVLSYIGSASGSTTQWSQYLAIGNGAITAVSPTDTNLANEVFRKTPSSFSVVGTQVDITTQLGSTDAQTSITNVGLFGGGASSTLGSGTLMTHALFSYTKGAYAVNVDYIVNLL